jgi:hypothetical protein
MRGGGGSATPGGGDGGRLHRDRAGDDPQFDLVNIAMVYMLGWS